MNKRYETTIRIKREKVLIIKLIRAINGWGLKDSKDFAEANFTFDSYMESDCTFDVVLNITQLGLVTAFAYQEHHFNRVDIMAVTALPFRKDDVFDFSKDKDYESH